MGVPRKVCENCGEEVKPTETWQFMQGSRKKVVTFNYVCRSCHQKIITVVESLPWWEQYMVDIPIEVWVEKTKLWVSVEKDTIGVRLGNKNGELLFLIDYASSTQNLIDQVERIYLERKEMINAY